MNPDDRPLNTRERNTLLTIIAALLNKLDINFADSGQARRVEEMVRDIDAKISSKSILNVFKQLPNGVAAREVEKSR
jgi:DNA polymerase/3'-5' exonuclease PolX